MHVLGRQAGVLGENSIRDIDLCGLAEHHKKSDGWTPQPHITSLLKTRICRTTGKWWATSSWFRRCGIHFSFFSALCRLKENWESSIWLCISTLNPSMCFWLFFSHKDTETPKLIPIFNHAEGVTKMTVLPMHHLHPSTIHNLFFKIHLRLSYLLLNCI